METIWPSLIAVVGTLLGAGAAYWFQRRNAVEANRRDRSEILRQERVVAYSSFAGALGTYRRSELERWYATRGLGDPEVAEEKSRESRQRRDVAREAFFRVQLLAGSQEVTTAGLRALDGIDAWFGSAKDSGEAEAVRNATYAAIGSFVELARQELDRELHAQKG